MRHALIAIVAAALSFTPASFAASNSTIARASATSLVHEQDVRETLGSLVRDARYGMSTIEESAFVVRLGSGRLVFVRWPRSAASHEGRWSRAIPAGAIAIVHTHPNWLPEPSRIDIRTAAHAHLVVYVLTRFRITMTDGGAVQTVVDGPWMD